MNCIIIEDEAHTADYLEYQLAHTGYEVHIQARMDRIEQAVGWLKKNRTDLIFLDIQLGDGCCFDIFDQVQVSTPVIFTTSYDQYAIRAFELNSLAYLLKPVKQDPLKAALEKFRGWSGNSHLNERIVPLHQSWQKRFLVQSGSSFITVPVEDVAYFQVEKRRYVILVTKTKQQYIIDNTLELLEQRLDPNQFFRINRQYILNMAYIKSMESQERGRLKVMTDPKSKEEMIVSIEKAGLFKQWLDQ